MISPTRLLVFPAGATSRKVGHSLREWPVPRVNVDPTSGDSRSESPTFTGDLTQADASPIPVSRTVLLGVAFVIGMVFFITEHDLSISLTETYSQTADEMEVAAAGGNGLRRLCFLAMGGMGLWLLFRCRTVKLNISPLLAAATCAYLFVAVASFLWSVDPGLCLRRLIVLGCTVLAALGIARQFSMRDLCWLVVLTIGPMIVLGLVSELRLGTFRPWSGSYRFSGSVHPNTQGMYLTTLGLAALGLARSEDRRRWVFWSIFAASLALNLLTKSRTGNASTLLAIGAVYLLQTPLSFKLCAGLAIAWCGAMALWFVMLCGLDPLVDFQDALLLGRAEQADSLSGRAWIWPIMVYFIGRRPWLGHGHESFWNAGQIDTISDELGWGLREAHNGYLEVLLSTGILGLTIAVIAVLAGLAAAARGSIKLRDPAYALPLGMLVFGLLASVMESGMVNIMYPPFLVACCLLRMGWFAEQPAAEPRSL